MEIVHFTRNDWAIDCPGLRFAAKKLFREPMWVAIIAVVSAKIKYRY